MKMHLYPNWKAKQRLFSFFFRGMEQERFAALGRQFADVIEGLCRQEVTALLRQHADSGATVYVVSAGIEE